MSSELGKIIADFRTSLAVKMSVGATTGTLQSATDDDGVSLPAGTYYFTIDGDNSQKEHIKCSLSGTALTSVYSVSRQGVKTSGAVREHRIGASVTITNFAHIKEIADLVAGTTDLNASAPLKYDGVATLTPGSNQLATVAYADGISLGGAPDANTTQKGVLEVATLAETKATTATGGTGATLAPTAATIAGAIQDSSWVYAADSVGTDSYAITLTPAITAYAAGQRFIFKAGTANTGAATLNVNAIGAKTIKKFNDQDLEDGDIEVGSIVEVVYDGTNLQMMTPPATSLLQSNMTNTEAGTLTAGTTSNADTLHTHNLNKILVNSLGTNVSSLNLLDTSDRTSATGFTETISGANGVIGEGMLHTEIRAGDANGRYSYILMDPSASLTTAWGKSFFLSFNAGFNRTANQVAFMGIGGPDLASTADTTHHIGFFVSGTSIYASNGDGSTQTITDITAAAGTPTMSIENTYQIEYTSGSNIKFSVNGTLCATHTTNLPSGSSTDFAVRFGIQALNAETKGLYVSRRVILNINSLVVT